jgi:hypothetical protein
LETPSCEYGPHPGTDAEKRPQFEALIARAFSFFMLYLFAAVILFDPRSALGSVFASLTKTALILTAIVNFLWWITLRHLRYCLDATGVAIRRDLRTLRIPYPSIMTVELQNAPWPIKKANLLTYAKEVPQLIEYVAQIGAFNVEGRGKIYLYSTLSSYHDPKGLILITTTDGKTYGISPAEPERFLEELEKRRGQARPQS